MYFHYFVISPWKRCGSSYEKTWIPLNKGCFVPSLGEIGPVVLDSSIQYFVIISFWKRVWAFISTNFNAFNPRMILPCLVEIDSVVVEMKPKMWNIYNNNNYNNDINRQRTNLNQKSSELKPLAKES